MNDNDNDSDNDNRNFLLFDNKKKETATCVV